MTLLQHWTAKSSAAKFDALLRGICAVVVVFFGAWTILAEALALSGHSYGALWRLSPLAVLLAVAILVFIFYDGRRQVGNAVEEGADAPSAERAESSLRWPWLLAGAALSAIFAFESQYLAFWVLAVLCLGAAMVAHWSVPGFTFGAASHSRSNMAAFSLAVVLALLAAYFLNRPNLDQTLGLNMAVTAMDHPTAGIYATDGLHGIRNAFWLPTYWAQSYELLGAGIANAFGITEPVTVFDLILGPFFAIFTVIAGALCLRRLLPNLWGWATLALVVILLVLRETYITYGNFAFVRMFEGKSIFLSALVPLIVLFAVEFFSRPRLGGWLLLLLVQVSAIGMTANALYAAPMVAGFTLVACWRPSWPATGKAIAGLLTCAYPVAVAVAIRSVMIRYGLSLEDFHDFIPIDMAIRMVLGGNWSLWIWLLALTSCWCLIRDGALRRWAIVFSFGFVLLCLNPYLDVYWGQYVTAKYLTWRLLWAVPLPLFLAIFVTQGLAGFAERGPGRKQIAAALGVSLALAVALGQPWIDPTLRLDAPLALKVPHPQYEVAARLNELAGEGKDVLAPEDVSAWVPTFRHHAFPLVARTEYTSGLLTIFANRIDTLDIQQRLELAIYVDGLSADYQRPEGILQQRIKSRRLSAIAVPANFARAEELTSLLESAGFQRSEYAGYLVFSR